MGKANKQTTESGDKLRQFMKSQGRSWRWLSLQTGIPYQRLYRIRNGAEVTFEEALVILKVLQVSPAVVFDVPEHLVVRQ